MTDRTWRFLAGCEMSGRNRDAFARTGQWDECVSADLVMTETPVPLVLFGGGSYVRAEGQGEPGAAHYLGDVLDLFSWDHPVNDRRRAEDEESRRTRGVSLPLWDLTVLNPPCTHLAGGGARWWPSKRMPRFDAEGRELPSVQDEAAAFFVAMTNAPAAHIAVENPRGDMTRRLGHGPDQYVQPYMFGDDVIKETGLWLRNLPLLVADRPVTPTGDRVVTGGGSHRTDKRRTGRSNNGHEDSEGRANRHIVRSRTPLGLARAMAEQWTPYVIGYGAEMRQEISSADR